MEHLSSHKMDGPIFAEWNNDGTFNLATGS
ncbi:hypothetical protein AGR7B_Lc180092 [Agrobacterium deltaense RV3]|nr:hypothetical protein AGR7B_Lc180092 [Agrobacterium deltaense RV3]